MEDRESKRDSSIAPAEFLNKRVIPILKGYPVDVTYLFGSYARGEAGPLSDVDIALLFEETIGREKAFHYRVEILSELNGPDPRLPSVDVVDVERCDLSLQYRIVQQGKVLFCRNETRRIRFEARIMSLYLDRKYYIDRHIQAFLDRVIREGFE